MYTIEQLAKFEKGFSTLAPCQLEKAEIKKELVSCEIDPVISEIFAPDPVTGQPRSDCYYVLSKDKNPVISQYIQDVLMQSHSNMSPQLETADDALLTVKTESVSLDDYKKQLHSLIAYDNK